MLVGKCFTFLLLTSWNQGEAASDTCGWFTYHHMPGNDDLNLSDTLELQITATRAECFSNCFHHRYCNRFLYNDQTGECHLHSTEGSPVSSAPGFKYYAADCTISKSLTPPTCPPQFAPFADSTAQCYDGDQWVDGVIGAYSCHQIEWCNTEDVSYSLPAPITPGFHLDIRGTWTSQTVLEYALDKTTEQVLVRLLVIQDGAAYSDDPSGPVYYAGLPISSGVQFDTQATFNSTHYQISLDGNLVGTFDLSDPLALAAIIYANNEQSLIHVRFIYP